MNADLAEFYTVEIEEDERPVHTVSGFASPAENYITGRINLSRELIRHPSTTYIYRTESDAMIDAGIHPQALIVFDARLNVVSGDIIVVRVNDEFCVREYSIETGGIYLKAANIGFAEIELTRELDFEICGKVVHSINGH